MKPLFPCYLVVDFKNTAYRAYAVGSADEQLKTSEGVPSGHVLRFFRMMQKLKKEYGGELVFCMEGGEKLRYELFPGYKEGRNKETPWLQDLVDLVKCMKCKVITPKEAEADDAIATFQAQNPKARHCIISADKDLWALLGSKTRIMSFQQEITLDKVREVFGVEPKAVPLAKALSGDSSDGLPSVPRLRWMDIEKAIEGCYTPEDLFARIDSIPTKTAEKLKEHRNQIDLVFKVACLRTDCELHVEDNSGDPKSMEALLTKWECGSLISSIPQLT